MKIKTRDAAKGKWRGILKELGLADEYMQNRHGPCPMCGGKDRYRFDDKDGSGSYYCNGCGAGDGMDLAMEITGMQFVDTAKRIDEMVGNIEAEQPRKARADPVFRIRRTLGQSRPLSPNDPVIKYLSSRKLPRCAALMMCPNLPYYDNTVMVGRFPAMVARYVSPSSEIVTLHITFLTDDGRKAMGSQSKKWLPCDGSMEGGAIRLTRVYPHIGIAEGIENALAVMKLYKVPCWATGTAGMMAKFKPPEGVESVTVYGDNDKNFTGHAAAYTLAHRLAEKERIKVDVQIPDGNGDFADILEGAKQEALQA